MREHASKVGGSSLVQRADAAEPAVGKKTLVEQASAAASGGEHEEPITGFAGVLAAASELAIDAVKVVMEANADELSKYSDHTAAHAKHQLHHILATCGPTTANIQRDVQIETDKLTNFFFARLMRQAAVQARAMTSASREFTKALQEHKHGALESFIHKSMLAAKELAHEFREFSSDVKEVDHIVHQIRARCGHPVPIAIPGELQPRITSEPLYKFYVNPKLSPDPHTVTLPGLKITGGHTALPSGIAIPDGALLGLYGG